MRPVRTRLAIAAAIAGLGVAVTAWATRDPWPRGEFSKHASTIRGVTQPFQAFVPRAYDPSRKWPVILFMHGGNEKGSDGDKQLRSCFAGLVAQRAAEFPAIVLFPQAPHDGVMERQQLRDFMASTIDSAARALSVDADRVSLVGVSMGGGVAYEMTWENPTRYAAVLAVSAAIPPQDITGVRGTPVGAVDSIVGARLGHLPTWVFHGTKDQLVTVTIPRAMIAAFRRAGMDQLRYTEEPEGTHSCLSAFTDPAPLAWLLAQRRGVRSPAAP